MKRKPKVGDYIFDVERGDDYGDLGIISEIVGNRHYTIKWIKYRGEFLNELGRENRQYTYNEYYFDKGDIRYYRFKIITEDEFYMEML